MNEEDQQENGYEGRGKPPRLRSASRSKLPQCSAVLEDPELFKQAVKLLKEAVKLKARMSEDKARLDEITAELGMMTQICGVDGFRHGMIGFSDYGWKRFNTLNKDLLVARLAEYGAPAGLIGECYEQGAEYRATKLFAFDLE